MCPKYWIEGADKLKIKIFQKHVKIISTLLHISVLKFQNNYTTCSLKITCHAIDFLRFFFRRYINIKLLARFLRHIHQRFI